VNTTNASDQQLRKPGSRPINCDAGAQNPPLIAYSILS